MLQSSQNEFLLKIASKVAKHLNFLESIITFLFVILLTLKVTTGLQVGVFIVIILSVLALLYFLNAFSVDENLEFGPMALFGKKVVSWGASVCVVSIQFGIMNWPGWDVQLNVGLSVLIFSLLLGLYLKTRENVVSFLNNRWILRIIVLLALCLVLRFVDHNELIRLGVINKQLITVVK